MLRIRIDSITDSGLNLDEREDAARLPLLNTVAGEGGLRFIHPVHVRIHATLSGETVLIDGIAETVVRIPCSRCLEPFDLKIKTDFSATAVPEIQPLIDPEPADEIELAADDMDVIAYSGDNIDLRDEIAQQIIMALPFKPLCRNACKGLCSRCGADLNQTPCQCRPLDEKSPFSVLKARTFPKKQE
ncbi:DUF177 domain-containing protein [uncultured Desulfosarcina sp.]|uniref:YceD family protein n=1 Tax=uncultured Desulfosarcina sp. TaxID=218289 RepID=UPI0029C8AEBD|nr:DUF177 domain-containing protein [uncultured Desulfosarcina sp.]